MKRQTDNLGQSRRVDRRSSTGGFTLLEVIASLGILAVVSSSVLLVISRCVNSAADSSMRMEAFRIVRENMEQTLSRASVAETVEYGMSDLYPDIRWMTAVEPFTEPISGQAWVRAVCSAEFTDASGETQMVELEHWITELSDQQAGQLLEEEDLEQLAADQLLSTAEDAADYAGTDRETVEQWVENGLLRTPDGSFVRFNLDIFIDAGGEPTVEAKAKQVESIKDLAMTLRMEQMGQGRQEGSDPSLDGSGTDPRTGLPYEELEKMGVEEVMKLLEERRR